MIKHTCIAKFKLKQKLRTLQLQTILKYLIFRQTKVMLFKIKFADILILFDVCFIILKLLISNYVWKSTTFPQDPKITLCLKRLLVDLEFCFYRGMLFHFKIFIIIMFSTNLLTALLEF